MPFPESEKSTKPQDAEPIDFEEYRLKKQQLRELQALWLERRALLWAQCESDPEVRAAVQIQCREDPLFWFDYFAWTYDPRELPHERVKPLILYGYQRELVLWMLALITMTLGTIETVNAIIEKSRDMGASWVIFLFVLWYWWFRNGSFCIISRKEEEVDKRGDLSTAYEKLRFCLRHIQKGFPIPESMREQIKTALPNADFNLLRCGFPWLFPEGFSWKDHDHVLLLINPVGGEITGESANVNAARGARETAVIFDELGAIENDKRAWDAAGGSSSCLFGTGTPDGPSGVLADLAQGNTTEKVYKQTLHWSKHPLKAAGLKYDAKGKPTSPWYEKMKEGKDEEWIARELDISYAKSVKGVIFENYSHLHQRRGLEPVAGKPIIRAWDPGVNFHVSFVQVDNHQRVLVLRELHWTNAHIRDVAQDVDQLSTELKRAYPGTRFIDCGDPAGAIRQASSAEEPEYDTLRNEFGINVDFEIFKEMSTRIREKTRINAIDNRLRQISGQLETPCLLVDVENCKVTHQALSERYRRSVDRNTGEMKDLIDVPHPWEDAVDCLGYAIIYKLGNLGSKSNRRGEYVDDEDGKDLESGYSWEGSFNKKQAG
jgi:hypothetical protein